MNLEQLRGFAEVADLGHFTRAAEHLHLAQPSLSRQIATLEAELGAQLFHRVRGHISLTDAGEALLPRARRMLAEVDTIRAEMAELAGLRRGRVRLGATPTLCISLVAQTVSAFHAVHPQIELQLVEGGSRMLSDQLAGGGLDIALVTEGAPDAGGALVRTPLLTEELVVVASADRPFLQSDSIDLKQLADLPLINFAKSYDIRAAADAAFRSAGLAPSPVLQGAEMDAVLRFVERGLGVALVPAVVLLDRPALRSARLRDPSLARTISLAQRCDVKLTPAASEMRRMIISTAAELAERAPETMRPAPKIMSCSRIESRETSSEEKRARRV